MTGAPLPKLAEDEIGRLKRAVEELTVLNELGLAISSTPDLDEIIGMIVAKATAAVGAQQVVLTMVNPEEMSPDGTMYREIPLGNSKDFHLSRNLLGCMYHERRALLINDAHFDPRLKGVTLDSTVKNLLCVPLLIDSELIAVLSACNKQNGGYFLEEDLRILGIMASQSAQVLDRARLTREESTTAKLKEDMIVATRIHNCLLPARPPQIEGYDFAGISVPARQVGGDYFDFIPMSEDLMGIALGDVSGKGVAAALLMSNLQAMLRGQLCHETRCGKIMRWCNRQLFLCTPLEKFATLFLAVLNTQKHSFSYCNAGHELPVLFSGRKTIKRLRNGGLAVGMMPDSKYSQSSLKMKSGDLIVIFSDGVTDVCNQKEDPFGEDRLLQVLEKHKEKNAAGIIEEVKKVIREYAKNQIPFDDWTMVVVKRN